MRWYLLKTWVGKEEELIEEIRREVPADLYKECFIIHQERIWRKQQKSIVHLEPLFPGCVFLTSETFNNETFINETLIGETFIGETFSSETLSSETMETACHRIERIPSISRWIACGCLTFLPMMEEDAEFLEKISGKDHVVKLSYVAKDEQGNICRLSDPLKYCQKQIERMQFKKRYAMIRHPLWGEDQVMVLGIVLKEDIPVKEMA